MTNNNDKAHPRNNVDMTMDGTVLVIRIETDQDKLRYVQSKSGKSQQIATTGGNTTVRMAGGIKLGLNAYIPLD